jgi:hypothetical protein
MTILTMTTVARGLVLSRASAAAMGSCSAVGVLCSAQGSEWNGRGGVAA